jgi:ornithine cyclodeaminase/alanine dehydrogenase-like protein (mu-crystallin family)
VVDSGPQAQKVSRKLMDFLAPADRKGWQRVRSLADLVAAGEPRDRRDDVTLFKSLGEGGSIVSPPYFW